MSIVTAAVSQEIDDCYDDNSQFYCSSSTTAFNGNSDTWVLIGQGSAGAGGTKCCGLRMTLAVAQGTTITSATLTLNFQYVDNSGGGGFATCTVRAYCNAVDDAPVFHDNKGGPYTGTLFPSGATTTTNYTSFTPTFGTTGDYDIDVTTAVQEVLNRGGWVSGNHIQFILVNDGGQFGIVSNYHDSHPATLSVDDGITDYETGAGAASGEAFATAIAVPGPIPLDTPVLDSRTWPELWCPGINYESSQARGLAFALPLTDDAQDVGPYKNHGTLIGNGVFNFGYDKGGQLGKRYINADSSSVIAIPQNPSFDTSQCLQGFAFCFNFFAIPPIGGPDTFDTNLLSTWHTSDGDGWHLIVAYDSGNVFITWQMSAGGGASYSGLIGTIAEYENHWWHCCFNFSPYGNADVETFFNGVSHGNASFNESDFSTIPGGGDFIIGGLCPSGDTVDTSKTAVTMFKDVRFYNRPLGAGEVWEIANQPDLLYKQPTIFGPYTLPLITLSPGHASGDSTATAVGASLRKATGTASGDSTAVGVGLDLHSVVGTASGDSTANAVGVPTLIGTASGDSTAVGVGASLHATVGTASGNSTANAVGVPTLIGSINGDSTANGVGHALAIGVGSSSGDSTAVGVGHTLDIRTVSADGSSSASAVSNAIKASHSVPGPGDSTAIAVGRALKPRRGTASGDSSAIAHSGAIKTTVGTASGDSTASGKRKATYAVVGTASGTSTASGAGLDKSKTAGTASGTSTASGIGKALARASGTAQASSTSSGATNAIKTAIGSVLGASTASGTAHKLYSGVGTAPGSSTASGIGKTIAKSVGTASGGSTALGTGKTLPRSVGTASGNSSASGVGHAIISAKGTSQGNSFASTIPLKLISSVGTASGNSTALGKGSKRKPSFGTAKGNSYASCNCPVLRAWFEVIPGNTFDCVNT